MDNGESIKSIAAATHVWVAVVFSFMYIFS